jgi:hypothetical protein
MCFHPNFNPLKIGFTLILSFAKEMVRETASNIEAI